MWNRFKRWLRSLFVKDTPPVIAEPMKEITELPKHFIPIALEITGSFEGNGYGQVTGNFDGQGMSCGILQWTLGTESLQSHILQPFIKNYSLDDLNDFFPTNLVGKLAYMSGSEAKRACKPMLYRFKRNEPVRPEWKIAWKAFLTTPETIELQNQAARGIAKRAWKYSNEYGIKSIRGFSFFFDVCVQNGSMKQVPLDLTKTDENRIKDLIKLINEENSDIWSGVKLTPEKCKLFYLAYHRAKKSNPRWFSDVLSRKGTIALGRGVVHGKYRDLTELE